MKPAARGRRVAIRRAGPLDLALLARLHAACFEEAWDSAALASLLAMPGACALIAGAGRGEALGFVILRAVAGEAEIISLGVEPRARRGFSWKWLRTTGRRGPYTWSRASSRSAGGRATIGARTAAWRRWCSPRRSAASDELAVKAVENRFSVLLFHLRRFAI